ncbi:MAG: ATP-binding protein [Nitrospirota bacterium]|nr:ATP-binding protein [Nitrospirota bacterium]
MAAKRIMVVEDEGITAKYIKFTLESMGYEVPAIVSSAEESLIKAAEVRPDIVLMDIVLQGEMSGIEAADRIRLDYSIPVIYLTAYSGNDILEKARHTEPYGYIVKPFEARELRSVVEMALHKHGKDRELRESHEWISVVNRNIGDAVILADPDGRIRTANSAALSLTGYSKEDITGKSADILLGEDSTDEFRNNIINVLGERRSVVYYKPDCRTKTGRSIPLEMTASLINDLSRGASMVVITARDLSQQEETEKALDEAKKYKDTARRNRVEFMANISHELRTPLNGIIGMADLLAETGLTEKQREYFDVLRQSADNLLAVVNDILVFSDAEAGRLEAEAADFDLKNMLEELVNKHKGTASGKGIDISCRIAPDVPGRIIGYEMILRQVVDSLLGNAVKFTESGKIIVDVSLADAGRGEDFLHFAVRDTGIGINKEKLKTIFEGFIQADGSRTRRYGGMGLGLAISKKLVRKLGGSIWAESEEGRGSTFHFTAGFEAATRPPSPRT